MFTTRMTTILSQKHINITPTRHHEHNKNDHYPKPKNTSTHHQHNINDYYPKPKNTHHKSCYHHNIINISTQHYKHTNATSYHHKKLKRLIITHQGNHHTRHASFISRKIHYLRKSKSFKKSIIQIHSSL